MTYTLHTKNNGSILSRGDLGDPKTPQVGDTLQFDFLIPEHSQNLTVEDSYTVGGVEGYGTITVESGATLTINGTLQGEKLVNNGTVDNNGTLIIDGGDTQGVINAFIEWAGQYNTLTMVNGVRKYSDRTPTSAAVDTLLIGIEPDTALQNQEVNGVWGLVESFEDARDAPLAQGRYSVSVFVLGEYGDYTDHSAVETELLI